MMTVMITIYDDANDDDHNDAIDDDHDEDTNLHIIIILLIMHKL